MLLKISYLANKNIRLRRFLFIFQIHSRLFSSSKDHLAWGRNEHLSNAGKALGSDWVPFPLEPLFTLSPLFSLIMKYAFGA